MNIKHILIALAILITAMFLLVAVTVPVGGSAPTPTSQSVDYVVFVHDDAHQVGCWLNQTGTAISCIPDPGRCDSGLNITETASLIRIVR